MPDSARTPIVEARGTVLTGWEGGLRIGVTDTPVPKTTTLGKSPNDPKVPSTRQGRIRGHRIKAPCRDGGGFFRWWIFCPSPTSSPPPSRCASGVALVALCAVGAYRCRRGPDGPRDHDGAPWGGRASRDRTDPRAFPGVASPTIAKTWAGTGRVGPHGHLLGNMAPFLRGRPHEPPAVPRGEYRLDEIQSVKNI